MTTDTDKMNGDTGKAAEVIASPAKKKIGEESNTSDLPITGAVETAADTAPADAKTESLPSKDEESKPALTGDDSAPAATTDAKSTDEVIDVVGADTAAPPAAGADEDTGVPADEPVTEKRAAEVVVDEVPEAKKAKLDDAPAPAE